MTYSLTQILWLFCIYSLSGWLFEVIFAAIFHRRIENRGFLRGPVCPIYGIGLTAVILISGALGGGILITFITAFVLTTGVEYITGLVSHRALGLRLWDYSDTALNVGGYICFGFSLIWGAGCVLIARFVHPAVMKLVNIIPQSVSAPVLVIILAALTADFCISLSSALEKKQLEKTKSDI